jgi:hypothetical protein
MLVDRAENPKSTAVALRATTVLGEAIEPLAVHEEGQFIIRAVLSRHRSRPRRSASGLRVLAFPEGLHGPEAMALDDRTEALSAALRLSKDRTSKFRRAWIPGAYRFSRVFK